jgi:hypothetical protein
LLREELELVGELDGTEIDEIGGHGSQASTKSGPPDAGRGMSMACAGRRRICG